MRISVKISFLSISACFFLLTSAYGQNFEIGANVGGQFNGGLDLSTTIFHRIEVGNSLNYSQLANRLSHSRESGKISSGADITQGCAVTE